ncbi:MAG: hypothetical protein ACTXOO_05295 [Sodalis sp. (in: enterobacteria)]
MLPKNFLQAIKSFGDDFPITGMHSFYFVDKYNLIPRRYSDFNTINEAISKIFDINALTRKEMMFIGRKGMYYQSSMRKNFGCDYLTGSLYILKSKLWNYCPQNELLYWDDYEDVEHGTRAASLGIPTIINPYSMTQSMNNRSIMHYYGYLNVFSHSGKLAQHRTITEILPFLRRKPLFKVTIKEAKRKLFRMAKKYSVDDSIFHCINEQSFSGLSRLKIIIKLIKSFKIPLWKMEKFVHDFERDVLCESLPPLQRSDLIEDLQSFRTITDKKIALIILPFLQNQVSHTLMYSPFMDKKKDWFIKKTICQNFFNILSAYYLKYFMQGVYLKLNVLEIACLIESTTVYQDKSKK